LGTEEIWPPTPFEAVVGYHRIDKLLDPRAVATAVIDQVTIFYPVYRPLIEELNKIAIALRAKTILFAYDWRSDLWTSTAPFTAASELLARAIDKSVRDGASSVTLVCHSMGCLVARLVIESPKYKNTSWYKKIEKFVAICGPHLGAPVALVRALGLEGSSGISADDMKRVAGDPRYPAGYQCFPAPGIDVLYDVSTGELKTLDIYNVGVDRTYDLTRKNVLAAQTTFNILNIDSHPSGIRYIFIAGQGFDTVKALVFNKLRLVDKLTEDGDGVVPVWSSIAGKKVVRYTMPGDHIGIMETYQFKQTLHDVLGSPMMLTLSVTETPGLTVTINKRTFSPEEMIDVVLVLDAPTVEIDGHLRVVSVTNVAALTSGAEPQLAQYGAGLPVVYRGAQTMHVSMRLAAPGVPGAYILQFDGTHRTTAATAAAFYVNKAATASPTVIPQGTRSIARTKGVNARISKMRKPKKGSSR